MDNTTSVSIHDWICEKGSCIHSYKYFETITLYLDNAHVEVPVSVASVCNSDNSEMALI